ncbi:MAG: hypothetical protein HC764_21065 [Pleurocapsa sp. CRU_1_2]|nr:hypothetical protein [Pleurocapsa sp. CRU_1_2]
MKNIALRVNPRHYLLLKKILKKNGTSVSQWFYYKMISYLSDHLWQLMDDPTIELTEGERLAAELSNIEPTLKPTDEYYYPQGEQD